MAKFHNLLKLQVPPTVARILLDRYKWQSHSISDKYFNQFQNDPNGFFRDARIMDPRKYIQSKRSDTIAECLICFEIGVSQEILLFLGFKIMSKDFINFITANNWYTMWSQVLPRVLEELFNNENCGVWRRSHTVR